MTVGIERLRTLYAVLAGVPASRLDLDQFYDAMVRNGTARPSELTESDCGTTACAGGWAAVYPEFVESGLYADRWGSVIYKGPWGTVMHYEALEQFFELSMSEADSIFGMKERSKFTKGLTLSKCTDRRVALHRIRLYLLQEGAITQERSNELALQEELQEMYDRRNRVINDSFRVLERV